MSELKPCPFCGGKALISAFDDFDDIDYMSLDMPDYEVTCENERCICGWYLPPEIWNTRPIEDALNKRITELEAENIRLGIEYQRMRLALGDIAITSKRALNESPTDQLAAHETIERQDDKSPNDTQTQTIVYGKECD